MKLSANLYQKPNLAYILKTSPNDHVYLISSWYEHKSMVNHLKLKPLMVSTGQHALFSINSKIKVNNMTVVHSTMSKT